MQTRGQLININTQAIAHLKIQMGQLTSAMSERELGRLPNQPRPNPRNKNGLQSQQENQVNQIEEVKHPTI